MMGIALWHFTVFLPERFWQGIVGAFIGSVIGAIVFGLIIEIVIGKGLGDTDIVDRADRDPRRGDRARRSSGSIGVRQEQARWPTSRRSPRRGATARFRLQFAHRRCTVAAGAPT